VWVYWSLLILGLWTLVSPWTFAYDVGLVQPSGARELWLSDAARVSAMTWSDVVSGTLLIVFGWRALTPDRPVSLWICACVGLWLSCAPLLFWAPTAAAYLNATFVGALVIALTVLVPGMPNMPVFMKMGPETPPGWTYNPSSWAQRSILIALGLAGWLVSRYLAAYQLGYIDTVWEPLFGAGSREVLDSAVSHALPISDAGLGSLAYTLEFLMGWMGSPARWRTMPWMVALFGVLVIPLGVVHIVLVLMQPLVVGHWCSLCLLAAAIMLPMIPLEVDEVVAMLQHLVGARRRGDSVWRAFWLGGSPEGSHPDQHSPAIATLPAQPGRVLKASVRGVNVPWTLALSALIGLWMLLDPAVFGTRGTAAELTQLAGALVIVVATASMAEVLRACRYLDVVLGAGLVVGLWLVDGANIPAAINASLSGAALIVLALPRGPIRDTYAGWDRAIV
jgi:hypothetical protein